MKRLTASVLALCIIMSMTGCQTELKESEDIIMSFTADNGDGTYRNPVIYSDVPDPDTIKVGDAFYMTSTTMHMTPGVPVMKSYDLVNWETVNYVYQKLGDDDCFALKNGKSDYAAGSWASSLRYDEESGWFIVTFSCNTTNASYFYMTDDIEHGKWYCTKADVICYDAGMLFDDDGRKYIFYSKDTGVNSIHEMCYREMFVDYDEHTVTLGDEVKLFSCTNYENPQQGLWGEGVHVYKHNGYYYIFAIQGVAWQRQEIVWRCESLDGRNRWDNGGDWECRKVFVGDIEDENGNKPYAFTSVAQGGIVETSDEGGYCFLFQDYGSVGRIPCICPFVWGKDGTDADWPIIGEVVADSDDAYRQNYMKLNYKLFRNDAKLSSIIYDDDFVNDPANYRPYDTSWDGTIGDGEYDYNGSQLSLQWQFNHNPDNRYWSLTEREGYLRLTAGYITDNIRSARNVATIRTYGPQSAAMTSLDISGLTEGDIAGLTMYQNQYGYVAVTVENGKKYVVMHKADAKDDATGRTCESVELPNDTSVVYLRIDGDFNQKTDKAYFYYRLSEDSEWIRIGEQLQMAYDWPDFVGYRFGLFIYATKTTGGYADFDYMKLSDELL